TQTAGLVYMGTGGGTCNTSHIWSSSDYGQTWGLLGTRPSDCSTTPYPTFNGISGAEQLRSTGRLVATTSGHIYVGTYLGEVLRSDDAGLTWQRIANFGSGHPLRSIAIPSATPSYLFAAVYGSGVYLSTN